MSGQPEGLQHSLCTNSRVRRAIQALQERSCNEHESKLNLNEGREVPAFTSKHELETSSNEQEVIEAAFGMFLTTLSDGFDRE